MNLSKPTNELDRLFDCFNVKYFSSKLEKPMIVIQSSGKKSYYGWFSIDKVWKDKETELHELAISAEYLNRDTYGVCSTMLHEMVHLMNSSLGIKDTSNGLKYHNKKFKESAEAIGLIIKHEKTIGWSMTELGDDIKAYVDTLGVDKEAFTIFRQKYMKIKTENKNKLYNYECKCGTQIKSKVDTEVMDTLVCSECRVNFFQVEAKRGRKTNKGK